MSSAMKIGFFANPHAGAGGKYIPRVARLRLKDTEILVGVTTHPGQVRDVWERFMAAKVDMIVIYGGDGTMQKILSMYFNLFPGTIPPPILLTRGGSMNIAANHYNGGGAPDALIAQMVLSGFTTIPHRLLKMESEGKWAGILPAYGSIFSLGAVVEMLKWYGQGKAGMIRALHTIAYGLALGLKIAKTSGIKTDQHAAKITIDGYRLKREKYLICFASTIPHLILHSSPFPAVPGNNDSFAWLAYDISAGECAINVVPLALGLPPYQDARYQFGVGESMVLSGIISDVTFDGEIFTNLNHPHGTTLVISSGPLINMVKVNPAH